MAEQHVRMHAEKYTVFLEVEVSLPIDNTLLDFETHLEQVVYLEASLTDGQFKLKFF